MLKFFLNLSNLKKCVYKSLRVVGWSILSVKEYLIICYLYLGGQGLFPGAALAEQLALLAIPPLHPPVLEPDLHLNPAAQN